MPDPSLKFAVVREDPELEAALVERVSARAALVVASGGCTALTLAARFPELEIAAFDLSPLQLAHAKEKVALALAGAHAALGVGTSDPRAHCQRGAFERLFRSLRHALEDLVIAPGELERFFGEGGGHDERRAMLARWTTSPYWAPIFVSAFEPDLLVAMFGPDAIRHAEPRSYGPYFQRAFERGLARPDAADNPFLAHVLLGRYTDRACPGYLGLAREPAIAWTLGSLGDVPRLERFGVVSLSNVFDWSDDNLVRDWAERLAALRSGSAVLVRVLNNARDVRPLFARHFTFDDALGAAFLEQDRSLFYERFVVGFRR